MTLVLSRAAAIALSAAALSGCATAAPVATPNGRSSLGAAEPPPSSSGHRSSRTPSSDPSDSSDPDTTHTAKPRSPRTETTPKPAGGPRIVTFRIAQRPKCAEGTAVFRAPAVPLIIEWKITGATRGALSVDDPTHTPGTYGPVGLKGTMDFEFSCAGDVGTTETHTYALYTAGNGPTRSATITASAKILDRGK